VFIKINGKTHYLWRAVDQHATVWDILVASRRDATAASRVFPYTAHQIAVRAQGAGHRQARQLPGGASTAHAQCGAAPLEVSEQPGARTRISPPANVNEP
jgi:DDE domain